MGTTTLTQREQVHDLRERLAEQVEALSSSDEWIEYLDALSRLYPYSFNNGLLIMIQCPHASKVAGYRKWQSLNRQVRKGERAISIFGPPVTRTAVETDSVTGEEVETDRTYTYFPLVKVFDLSQTEVLDPEVEDPFALVTTQLQGADVPGIYTKLSAWLAHQGWEVTQEPLEGVEGVTMYSTNSIKIDSALSPAGAAHTLLRQAAHALLRERNEGYGKHQGVYEVEAESVAYVVCGILGVDTSAVSVGYVTGWSEGDPDLVRELGQRVRGAVNTLATALLEG